METTPMISIEPIAKEQRNEFLRMGLQYFRELSPAFRPDTDWQTSYFENIQKHSNCHLDWIVSEDQKIGFILFGMEDHHFLPRKTGVIWDLYVRPEARRKGIARKGANLAIKEMAKLCPSKIRLEVVSGNESAVSLWESLGFRKAADTFVMLMPTDSWK
jgi:ribosomal protein S18 acetylase RimI-like enzyme